MSLAADARIAWRMLRGQPQGADHQARLDGFYAVQADGYDRFRERLLHGRAALCADLGAALPDGARLAEFGAGTARNLDFFGADLQRFASVHAVDLCPSLLRQAQDRIARRGWDRVRAVEADVTRWRAAEPLDAVLCSYSLTMVPDWFAAVDNALANLRPGGLLAVVDFYVSRAHPDPGLRRHSGLARWFWPAWFSHDGVRPCADHLPYLRHRTMQLSLHESTGRVPLMCGLRAPYYRYLGRKA